MNLVPRAQRLLDYLRSAHVTVEREEDDLFEVGQLDSGGVVELVLFLEESFGVEIDPAMITREHFSSVKTVVALLDRLAPP
ncbi:MAG: acyl carrier protein [Magnetococcales bacterium]|nr:acyl carrier protein [Magnetococcales bacterium]NGZ28414.1 acyl carrier protein [Magnetococcales bacterium]